MFRSKKVVILEGLIGCGKTTLSRELRAALETLGGASMCLLEPDEKDGANPYLASYYGEAARWAFTMQAHLLASRYRMHLHAQWYALQGAGHAVLDRSFYGDVCFANLQLKLGLMSPDEFKTYQMLYQAMTANVLLPNVCIRLLATPETCNARIAKRMMAESGRSCESAIDLSYLQKLDHEISGMVEVLQEQGVTVLNVPWDDNKPDPQARREFAMTLASRIISLEPKDRLLDLHRRTI